MAEITFPAHTAHPPWSTRWCGKTDTETEEITCKANAPLGEAILTAQLEVPLIVANVHILNYDPPDYPDIRDAGH